MVLVEAFQKRLVTWSCKKFFNSPDASSQAPPLGQLVVSKVWRNLIYQRTTSMLNCQHLWAGQSNSAVCKGAGLSGSIPKELSNCKKLTLINLSFNAFTGSIPEELADLEAIATFFVEGLSGHIPDWIRNRASVRSISLAENMFSGPLPVLPLQHSLQKPTSSQVLSQPRYVKPTLCSHSYCTITIWLGVL